MLHWENTYYPLLNALGREPLDPLLSAVVEISNTGAPAYFALQLLVVGAGVLAVSRRYLSLNGAVLAGVLFVLGCFLVYGFDSWAWRWHWFPLTLAASLSFCRRPTVLSGILYVLCLGLLLLASGSLAVASIAAVPAFNLILGTARTPSRRFVIAPALVLLLIAFVLLPEHPLPALPSDARLSPISPLTLYEPPLIGPALERNTMLFEPYQSTLRGYAVRTTVFTFALLLSVLWSRSKVNRKALFSILGISFAAQMLLIPEWLFPHTALYWAPFPSLARFIPGIALAGGPWLLLPFLLLTALIIVCRSGSRNGLLAGATVLAGMCVIWTLFVPERYQPLKASHAPGEGGAVFSPGNLTNSPFRFVQESWGEFAANPNEGKRREELYQLKGGSDFEAEARAEPNNAAAASALDSSTATRWSTGRPQQPGDRFELHFKEPTAVLRVVLSLRGATTDFPRGLIVSGKLSDGEHIVFHEFSDWVGPLEWTKDGYPYFGRQSEVIIDFPEPVSLSTLKFLQTTASPLYDWSIVELRLYADGPPRYRSG